MINTSVSVQVPSCHQLKLEVAVQLQEPTIEVVSIDEVYNVISNFNITLPVVSPTKQKQLLHSLISRITINPSNDISQRSIQDIELVFDASLTPDYVFTYGTVLRAV